MSLRFVFLLITRLTAGLELSRREEAWNTAEILILRHQFAILQRRQPRRPKLNWADRALLAALLGVIPKAGATWNPAHPARQPGCNADHGQKNGANKTSAHQAKIAKDRG